MYVDKENLYSDAQAVTASAGSTNIIDHGIARDLGTGEDIYAVVLCDIAMTDASSDSTLTVTIETDDDVNFGSPTTAAQTIGVFAALSAIGTIKYAKLQPGAINERYSRIYYTTTGGNLTTGSFTAFLTKDIHKYVNYAKGYTIS